MKPVCYHSATATSYVEGLKDGFVNHLKYSLVSTFLSEINKAISYFIYTDNTLMLWNLIMFKGNTFVLTFWEFYQKSVDLISNCLCQMQTTSMGAVLIASL